MSDSYFKIYLGWNKQIAIAKIVDNNEEGLVQQNMLSIRKFKSLEEVITFMSALDINKIKNKTVSRAVDNFINNNTRITCILDDVLGGLR